MASRFDQWVPTAPVQLPIDTYQAAAFINEQRTQQAVDAIGKTMQAYRSIQPYGKNATAVYDNAMEKLRATVSGITKMDLNTPEAKRMVNMAIGDPDITRDLKNVLSDSLLASEKLKEEHEYLKKNPSTNTYPYRRLFETIAAETGDPDAFDPHRFKNLGPLVDYVDTHKIITEEVEKFKQDKTRVKRILGPYYHLWETSGVGEDRIRKHVMSQLMTNPLISEQVNRDLESSIFRHDHLNRDNGIKKMAVGYRQAANDKLQDQIIKIGDNINNRIAELTAANQKIAKKIRPSLKTTLATDKELAAMKQDLQDASDLNGKYTDPSHPKYEEDEDQVREIYMNSYVNGFDALANKQTTNEWTYNEWAKAQWDAAIRMRLARFKAKQLKEALTPIQGSVNRFNLPQTQGPVLPQDMRSVIGRIPGLEGVVPFITDHGGLEIPKPGAVTKGIAGDLNKLGEQFYDNVLMEGKDAFLGNKPGTSHRYGGPEKKYTQDDFEKMKGTVKKYLINHGSSDVHYNGFKTENDVRDAVQDIMKNHQATESGFSATYTVPQSGDPSMRQKFAYEAATHGMFDNNGQPVDPATRAGVLKYMQDTKGVIGVTPTIRGGIPGSSYNTTMGPDGIMYHVPMDEGNNGMMAPARNTAIMGMRSDIGLIPNNDLSLTVMEMEGAGQYRGQSRGYNIPLAATDTYQKVAEAYFNDNLKKAMGLGYNKEDATVWLNSHYNEIHDQLVRNKRAGIENKPVVITGKGGSIEIYVPVKKRGEVYFSEFPLLDNQFNRRGIMDMNSYMENHVQNFSEIDYNKYMYQGSENQLQMKTKQGVVIGQYLDDDDDTGPANYDMSNYEPADAGEYK